MTYTRATAVVLRDENILLIHRHRDKDEYYVLPGGHCEKNETVEESVLRELSEETSIEATIREKIFEYTYKDVVNVLFLCDYVAGMPKIGTDSPEASRESFSNSHEPTWIAYKEVASLPLYPEQMKKFLIEYLGLEEMR